MTENQVGIIVGAGVSVVSVIIGFVLNAIYSSYREKKRRREERLRIHFIGINHSVVSRIKEMSLGLTIRKNRVVFGNISPVAKSYDFQKEPVYKSFELHFPEKAKEWLRLNNKALDLKEVLDKTLEQKEEASVSVHDAKKLEEIGKIHSDTQLELIDALGHLQNEFQGFARRIVEEAETIGEYQMGTVFKYNPECPICKKIY
ncbi:hypothetical protein ACFLU4_00575 [Chloroflexota bacterium]